MAEKIFVNNPRLVISKFNSLTDSRQLPPLNNAFDRVNRLINHPAPHRLMQNDLGRAITLATDPALEHSSTEILALMLEANSAHLPIHWRMDSEIQRTIFSMTSSIESGLLIAHSVWAGLTEGSTAVNNLNSRAVRLQLLHLDLQAT